MDGMIEQVRQRAYELWQMNGMSGCDVAHWTAAEMEIHARTMTAGPAPAKKKTSKAATLKATGRKSVAGKAAKKDGGFAAAAI